MVFTSPSLLQAAPKFIGTIVYPLPLPTFLQLLPIYSLQFHPLPCFSVPFMRQEKKRALFWLLSHTAFIKKRDTIFYLPLRGVLCGVLQLCPILLSAKLLMMPFFHLGTWAEDANLSKAGKECNLDNEEKRPETKEKWKILKDILETRSVQLNIWL